MGRMWWQVVQRHRELAGGGGGSVTGGGGGGGGGAVSSLGALRLPVIRLATVVGEGMVGNRITWRLVHQPLQLLEMLAEWSATRKAVTQHALVPCHLLFARQSRLAISDAPL